MSGNSKKKQAPPTGPEHQPEAVRSHKRRRLQIEMSRLHPSLRGSAKYQRLNSNTRRTK